MIDRTARDRMAAAIESYMSEDMTSFQFDDALSKITDLTEDKTVVRIGTYLWLHYDDCIDHKIVASKQEWDYFNRLLLILKSETDLDSFPCRMKRRWTNRNKIAAFSVVAFVVGTLITGGFLIVLWPLLAILSMLLSYWKDRQRAPISANEIALMPFPSIASLLRIRRSVPEFVKKRFPPTIQKRRIRGPIENKIMSIPTYIIWFMAAPIILLIQSIPDFEEQEPPQPITTPDIEHSDTAADA